MQPKIWSQAPVRQHQRDERFGDNPLTIAPQNKSKVQKIPEAMQYQMGYRVILITEVHKNGIENPVALAFVERGTKVVIFSLRELL